METILICGQLFTLLASVSSLVLIWRLYRATRQPQRGQQPLGALPPRGWERDKWGEHRLDC